MITAPKESFARLKLHPSGCWVVRAERPLDYAFGRAYGTLELCYSLDQAPVFVLERAQEYFSALVRLFPKARLESATFEEWINQPNQSQNT